MSKTVEHSDEAFDVIEQIAEAKGKEKQAILAKYIGSSLVQGVLIAALDPFKTYGIAKMPMREKPVGSDDVFDKTTWSILERLATRALSGNEARYVVQAEMERLSDKSAELFKRIILKDLRAGFGDSTVNKVAKGLLPSFPYMRCSLPSKVKLGEWNWPAGQISQEKADGMFANVNHEDSGHVEITSRQGSPFPLEAFGDSFIEEVRHRLCPGTQTHGEFLVRKGGEILPREKSNGVMNRILKGGEFEEDEFPVYQVWDSIPLSAVKPKGKYKVPYAKRLHGITSLLRATDGKHIFLIPTRIVHSLEEAYEHYRELLAEDKEGTIVKSRTAIWSDGTSKEQVKLKLEVDVDLKVVAIAEGRAATKNEGRAGALVCETSCGQLRVDVTVKNEKMRDHVDANPDEWIGKVIVVRANSICKPSDSNPLHSLFLPRMVEAEYRTDKDEADDLQRVFDQFESAVEAA